MICGSKVCLFQGYNLQYLYFTQNVDICRETHTNNDDNNNNNSNNNIEARDGLILLRASFGVSRVQHLLCCSASVDSSRPKMFDDLLRSASSRIANNSLSDSQWLQASLPIRFGRLGIQNSYYACTTCLSGFSSWYSSASGPDF